MWGGILLLVVVVILYAIALDNPSKRYFKKKDKDIA